MDGRNEPPAVQVCPMTTDESRGQKRASGQLGSGAVPDRRFKDGLAPKKACMTAAKPLVPQAGWNPYLTLMLATPTVPPPPPPVPAAAPAATAPAGQPHDGDDDHDETERVRRKHRRVVALPNLPKGFTVGEAVLGPLSVHLPVAHIQARSPQLRRVRSVG